MIAFQTGKGVGSLIGGQLKESVGLPTVFVYAGICVAAASTVSVVFYHAFGKPWENDVIERKKILLEGMEERRNYGADDTREEKL